MVSQENIGDAAPLTFTDVFNLMFMNLKAVAGCAKSVKMLGIKPRRASTLEKKKHKPESEVLSWKDQVGSSN